LLDIFFFNNCCALLVHWLFIILIYDIDRQFNLTQWVRYYLGKYKSKLIILCNHHSVPLELAETDLSLCNLARFSNLDNELIELNEEGTAALNL